MVSSEGTPFPRLVACLLQQARETYTHSPGTVLYAWEMYTYCNRTGSSLSFSMDSP